MQALWHCRWLTQCTLTWLLVGGLQPADSRATPVQSHTVDQRYDLGFQSADLVEEAAGLRAHGLPIPANDSDQAAAAWKYWEQPSDGLEFACAYNTSGTAVVLAAGDANSRQPSARSCAEACSARPGCTAWGWCKDSQERPCFDAQSGTWVQHHGCALLQLPVLPMAPPDPADLNTTAGADRIRSFAAGYAKRGLYMRLPRVAIATAVQHCARSDWSFEQCAWANRMAWLSVQDKMNFARLHGTTFHLVATEDPGGSKAEMVSQLLTELESDPGATWLLWTDVQSVVINPAFAFPLVSSYDKHGADLVVSGKRGGVLGGNSRKFDASVLLVRNTPWARGFFREAHQALRRPAAMAPLLAEDIRLHGEHNATLEQAIMYLLLSDGKGNQPKVYFEHSLCMACVWDLFNVRAPTSYISLFPGQSACNAYSLQQDSAYFEGFMNHTHLARCNFMKALHRAAPLEAAHAPLPVESPSVTLMDWVMEPGHENLREDAAACRAACAEDARCTVWLWCARAGGCDDGQDIHSRLRPRGACDLLDAPATAPLAEAARGPLFSSFSIGFMHNYLQQDVPAESAPAAGHGAATPKAGKQPGPPQGAKRGSGKARRQRGRRRTPPQAPRQPPHPQLRATPPAADQPGRPEGRETREVLLPFWERQVASGHSRRVPPPGHPNVAIITAMPPNPCSFPIADHFNSLGVINKQDYARRHGWELHLSAENVDPNAVGNYNKMAFIRQMLATTPRSDAEWIWWTDADTLITDIPFEFPFDRYKGHDLVVWGQRERVAKGDMEGINCGVMMFCNSDWSRAFLEQLWSYAHLGDAALQEMHATLAKQVYPLVGGFHDTPFIVYMLKTQAWDGRPFLDGVYFEQQIPLNRHWIQVDWQAGAVPLLVHYAGCSACSPPEDKLNQKVELGCSREFAKAYAFARCGLAAAYQNVSRADVCHYPAVNLSNVSIRLGE